VQDTCQISAEEIALCYQNFLICIEMFFASIGMYYGFTHKVYMNVGIHASFQFSSCVFAHNSSLLKRINFSMKRCSPGWTRVANLKFTAHI
jgi:hypothetical protein